MNVLLDTHVPQILTLAAIDVRVIMALDGLPASFHGGPADRLIVATARAHDWPLATHDAAIRRSRVVTHWKPPGRSVRRRQSS